MLTREYKACDAGCQQPNTRIAGKWPFLGGSFMALSSQVSFRKLMREIDTGRKKRSWDGDRLFHKSQSLPSVKWGNDSNHCQRVVGEEESGRCVQGP